MRYEDKFIKAFQKFKDSKDLIEENKETIVRFIEFNNANGLKKSTQLVNLWSLSVIARLLGKQFEKATKEDMIRVVNEVENNYKSIATKRTLKIDIKKFYKWLRDSDSYPEEVKWLKAGHGSNNHRLPETILTKAEIEALANSSENLRDRALILCLYESGCRIGELLSIKLKNILTDDYGYIFIVDGKTGSRRVRVIEYAKDLTKWLEIHPLKEDSESYLWTTLYKTQHRSLDKVSVSVYLSKLARKIGISKRVNPHSFRHARATHLAQHLTEAQRCAYFGWVQGSKMAAIYTHLAGKDVDDGLLKSYGIKGETKEIKPISNRECQRCGEINSVLSQFCKKCNYPLDMKTAIQIDVKREKIDELLFEFLSAVSEEFPQIKQKFRTIVKDKKMEELFK